MPDNFVVLQLEQMGIIRQYRPFLTETTARAWIEEQTKNSPYDKFLLTKTLSLFSRTFGPLVEENLS